MTYRDTRLRDWQWIRSWISFTIALNIGAFANAGVVGDLFELDPVWILAAIAGVLVGEVLNGAVTMIYTWWRRPVSG